MLRACRMRANLVDVALDTDGGVPCSAAVRGAGDTADVDVREDHRSVRRGGDRSDAERRSDALTVDDCRTRVPRLAPVNGVEAAQLLDRSVRPDAQHAGVVGPDVDDVANRNAAREITLRLRDRAPPTVGSASAKRVPVDDGERAATPVRGERSHRLIGEFLCRCLAGDDEQPLAPGRHKYRWYRQIFTTA